MIDKAIAFAATWWKLGLAIVAACSLSFILGQFTGIGAERARWEAAAAKVRDDSLERARAADAARAAETSNSINIINQAREALDNATRTIPDEAPSAGRRARICAELREQARRGGAAPPPC